MARYKYDYELHLQFPFVLLELLMPTLLTNIICQYYQGRIIMDIFHEGYIFFKGGVEHPLGPKHPWKP